MSKRASAKPVAACTHGSSDRRRVDNRRPIAVKWPLPAPATTGGHDLPEGPSMTFENARARLARGMVSLLVLGAMRRCCLPGCGKDDKKDVARPPLEVTALTIVPRDVPVTSVFVAQTQSSQAVNIAARVSGFLDKRVYTEGSVVKAGTGAVPDGPEAVPGAGRRPGRGAAAQSGGARGREGEPHADQAARRAERAVAEGSRRRAGPVRAGAAAVAQGKAQLEQAQARTSRTRRSPRRSTASASFAARRRRHVRQSAEQPAHHGVGADADVDQLQPLRERDAAHPQRRCSRG